MMLSYVCEKDLLVFRVSKLDPEIHILSVLINCPVCQTPIGVSADTETLACMKVRVLTATELYRASNGLGLPDFQHASFDRVLSCLIGNKVTDVSMEAATPTRIVLHSLVMSGENHNSILHFGTSTRGATIYKITEA